LAHIELQSITRVEYDEKTKRASKGLDVIKLYYKESGNFRSSSTEHFLEIQSAFCSDIIYFIDKWLEREFPENTEFIKDRKRVVEEERINDFPLYKSQTEE